MEAGGGGSVETGWRGRAAAQSAWEGLRFQDRKPLDALLGREH
jgi:hypothetical protein